MDDEHPGAYLTGGVAVWELAAEVKTEIPRVA
jgi:hypothetical protein